MPEVATKPRSPWILGRTSDLGLFVATPLLIVPIYAVIRLGLRPEAIALYVAAFGALGHHLPGMIRAYGDRALFSRFRVRFIAAPLFFGLACSAAGYWDLETLSLVVVIWGIWHGLMQTYGFARIYDGKVRSTSKLTSWLDFALCVSWFGVGIVLSPNRFHLLLQKYHVRCAGPMPPAGWVAPFQAAWAVVTGAVTALFLYNLWRSYRRGEPVSVVKLLLFVSSFGFWWYTHVTVAQAIVGVALFEVFHDVQYLSIVWVYNRSRVDRDPQVGGFTRFLFRNSGALIGVYVGMVFAYGALAFIPRAYSMDTLNSGFQGVLLGSALLHFYYDGFIWKLREASTGSTLGLVGAGIVGRLTPWMMHGFKWAVFLVPVALLLRGELTNTRGVLERRQWVADALPDSPPAFARLGESLEQAGHTRKAADAYEKALALGSQSSRLHNNAGVLYLQLGNRKRACELFARAVELDPYSANAYSNLGYCYYAGGDTERAIAFFRKAVELDPGHQVARENLAQLLGDPVRMTGD